MKYSEDEWFIKKYGLEKCKRMDAYYEDLWRREKAVAEKAFEHKDELFRIINEKTGLNLKFTMEKREKRNGDVILDIESDEIKNPVIALAWKSFVLDNFGGGTTHNTDNEKDFLNLCSQVDYYMPLHFSYTHIDGGYNGAKIGFAIFSEKDLEWKVKLNVEE